MTYEQALNVSAFLADKGYSHTVQVGCYSKRIPYPACRVDVLWPPHSPDGKATREWSLARMNELRDLLQGAIKGVELYLSSFDHKLYIGTAGL